MALKLIAVVALLAIAYLLFAPKGDIDGAEARRLVKEGALLLDVRTPEEFAAGHLPDALNIPVQELEQRIAELGPKQKSVVVYCRSGNRSGRAARLLKREGYPAVRDLGGMSRW